MTMTLEQVRDALKGVWVPTHWGTDGRSYKMSDLIESLDHYLSQPHPVAQVQSCKLCFGRGERTSDGSNGRRVRCKTCDGTGKISHPVAQVDAVAEVRHFNYSGIARNGFSQEVVLLDSAPAMPEGTKLYDTPNIPTGHRVVPVARANGINEYGQLECTPLGKGREGMSEWLPIDSAPRDGTRILAYAEREGYEPVTISSYGLDGRGENGIWAMTGPRTIPSHWMPLPAPPTRQEKEA